jgi:hypothetical protein
LNFSRISVLEPVDQIFRRRAISEPSQQFDPALAESRCLGRWKGPSERGRNTARGIDYSPNAKGNFTFERVICGWRTGLSVTDLRLKK